MITRADMNNETNNPMDSGRKTGRITLIFLLFILAVGFVAWQKYFKKPPATLDNKATQVTQNVNQQNNNSTQTTTKEDNTKENNTHEALPNPDKILALEALKRDDYAVAIASLNKVLTVNPTDAEAVILKENAYLALAKVPTWTIGVAGPFTGTSKQKGEAQLQGAALAQAQLNKAGGIAGKKIKILLADDQSTPEGALKAAQELVQNREVIGVIGHINSSATLAAAPIYNASGLVNISPSSTNPAVSDQGDYTFRVCNDDNAQGRLLAKWAVKSLNKNKVAILYNPTDQYSKGLAQVFKSQVGILGGQVISEHTYSTGQKDFATQAATFKNSGTEVVFAAASYSEAAYLAKELRKVASNAIILGGDGLYSQELIQIGGSSVEGSMFSTFFHAGVKKALVQQFVKQFANKFGGGTPNARAALSYDAFKILAEALKKGGTTRQKLQQKVAIIGTKLPSFPGVTGLITFDANGDTNQKEMVILRVENNKIVPVQLIQP